MTDEIKTGIEYGKAYEAINNAITEASQTSDINEKSALLLNVENSAYTIYSIINKNPESTELKDELNNLENIANNNGFVITEKGIFLSNKRQ